MQSQSEQLCLMSQPLTQYVYGEDTSSLTTCTGKVFERDHPVPELVQVWVRPAKPADACLIPSL
ncbi:hypothetical protein PXNS11_150172 [Stutzerimonas xanthomarina]|nr:hypothetical protein PXNS11_150172 [Stutzerimonas xanthomarina]